MDAIASDAAAFDRRPSVSRLAAALRPALAGGAAEALILPLCFVFARHFRFDSADPHWPDRDRLAVESGLAPLGGVLAALAGLREEAFASHGPAFGTGAGFALAERLLAARFGRSLVDHRSWVVASADTLATGAVQEAAWLAGAWRLSRLTAMVGVPAADAPGLAGFAAAGWSVRRVDAGTPGDVAAAMSAALRSQRPTLIASVLPADAAMETPQDITAEESRQMWAATGKRSAGVRRAWLKRLARHGSRADFENAAGGRLPHGWYAAFFEPGPLLPPGQAGVSTSWTLRRAIARMGAAVPELARLPADAAARQPGLTGDMAAGQDAASGMATGLAASAVGLALHGGVIPVSRHTLEEADGLWPGLRAAAASGLRSVTLITEPDAACAGDQRSALRAVRNLSVFRPADASEALECAELAFRRTLGPTVILVSETAQPLLADRPSRTRCAKGGYVVAEAAAPRMATLIASGPDLQLALAVRTLLEMENVAAAVVSLPCWDVFARQEPAWHEAVLGDAPRVGIEAGGGFGWDRWLGPGGLFIGTDQMRDVGWNAARPHAAAQRIAGLVLRHVGPRAA